MPRRLTNPKEPRPLRDEESFGDDLRKLHVEKFLFDLSVTAHRTCIEFLKIYRRTAAASELKQAHHWLRMLDNMEYARNRLAPWNKFPTTSNQRLLFNLDEHAKQLGFSFDGDTKIPTSGGRHCPSQRR